MVPKSGSIPIWQGMEVQVRVALMAPTAGIENSYQLSASELFRTVGGNTGNLAFIEAISIHLKRQAVVVPWEIKPDKLREVADIVVFAGANQLGAHTHLGGLATLFEAAKLPVVVIGLGAQADSLEVETTIPEGTLRWLKVVSDLAPSSAPNIGVRGEYSYKQIERVGFGDRAIVTGCPSNFMNLESDFASVIEARLQLPIRRIVSAVGQHRWGRLADIERSLLDLVDSTFGSCVVQSGELMVQLGQGELSSIPPAEFELLRAYFRPELTSDEFAVWCRRNMLAFGNVPSWRKWLAQHDFVVGPRFHGVMLAIQSGVPAGCIAHDSRTIELCTTMGIPVRKVQDIKLPISLQALSKLFSFSASEYRAKRQKLAKAYVSILQGAKLDFDGRLLALSSSV
ncbi:polysaccharide pyruvyl transferase family protein [Xanthobacter versatilis]|uniref:polysaccharide pyruvyl transferase family protein n=1 Tax=Xanthobacter autotrophicus (strain ATCC BAA-1158 / Py2) TaxID=78245 RepID=UPI003727DE6C